ncbi:unnamed protein product [Peronospora belbahrii]|uniref:Jacalin-type lectin domain-containing protein n=1 Tax=Peronospora belbahrii TaxID=622444 RepID=A0AAU9KR00_9STRA|nr:unnamed protein product [Peronospora belbahrii]
MSPANIHESNLEERDGFLGINMGPPAVEGRDEDLYATTTPMPGFVKPSVRDYIAQHGSFLDDFVNVDALLGSGSDASEADTNAPATNAKGAVALASDRVTDEEEIKGTASKVPATNAKGVVASASDEELDVEGLDQDEDMIANLGSEDEANLMQLMGSGASGITAALDGSKAGEIEAMMKKLGGLFSMVDGFSLFGGDPTVPQNKTIEDNDIILGQVFGGKEHGDAFSDINNVRFGGMFLNITLRGGQRLDKIVLEVMTQEEIGTLSHGGSGGGFAFVEPQIGEGIASVEVNWNKHNGKTCIFYMKLTLTGGKTISAGKETGNKAVIKPPKNYKIAGFHGRASSKGIFCIGAIYTRVGAVDLKVTDVMAITSKGSPDIYNYNTTIRNWVGKNEHGKDTACYQKRVDVSSTNMCPSGYRQEDDTCVAQCPLDYPVECYKECIPQNNDCAQAVLAKVSAVAAVVLNAATMGLFGSFVAMGRVIQFGIQCALSIANAVKSLIYYLRYTQTEIPKTDLEKLADKAFQMQIAMLDLPIAVATCLGIPIPPKLLFTAVVMVVVSAIVMMAVVIGEQIFSSKKNIMRMLRESGAMNGTALNHEVLELEDFIKPKNGTCGYEMKTLTNRVLGKVHEIRSKTPKADEEDVRVAVSKSPIITDDIPIITNHCMGQILPNTTHAASFSTRHLLRKTLSVIIEQLIKTGTTDMGKHVSRNEKILDYSDLGLFMMSMFDPTGIAWMASEFVQPICGPSEYIGEIDDGTLYDALGLTTVDQAFVGSYGVWKKKGDGSVTVYFESVDKFEVEVVIYSGSEKVNTVKVPANGKAKWSAKVEDLEDKSLYMDRWRPGLFGLRGSGGGSLLMWVPRSSQGGNLIMHVRLNVS